MLSTIFFLLATLLLILPNSISSLEALSYYFEYESLVSMKTELNRLNFVSFDMFALNGVKGKIRGNYPNRAKKAMNGETKGLLCVSNYARNNFQMKPAHILLHHQKSVHELIKNLVSEATNDGFIGVNVDFENLAKDDREKYSGFIHQLASELHANNLILVVSVPAMEQDSPKVGYLGAYDYQSLGQNVDILQVMTYDEYGPWEMKPGPVAGLDWVEKCINYAKTVVPMSKISMGVPAYGYDWDLTARSATTVTWVQIPALIGTNTVNWDSQTSSPWFTYTDKNGHHHEVWFENAQSIQLKGNFARSAGIGGVSVWALGEEDQSFWNALLNTSG